MMAEEQLTRLIIEAGQLGMKLRDGGLTVQAAEELAGYLDDLGTFLTLLAQEVRRTEEHV